MGSFNLKTLFLGSFSWSVSLMITYLFSLSRIPVTQTVDLQDWFSDFFTFSVNFQLCLLALLSGRFPQHNLPICLLWWDFWFLSLFEVGGSHFFISRALWTFCFSIVSYFWFMVAVSYLLENTIYIVHHTQAFMPIFSSWIFCDLQGFCFSMFPLVFVFQVLGSP